MRTNKNYSNNDDHINDNSNKYNWFTVSLYDNVDQYSTKLFNSMNHSNDSIDKLGRQFTQLAVDSMKTHVDNELIKHDHIKQFILSRQSTLNIGNSQNSIKPVTSTTHTPSMNHRVPAIDKRQKKSIHGLNNTNQIIDESKRRNSHQENYLSMNCNNDQQLNSIILVKTTSMNSVLPTNNMIKDVTSIHRPSLQILNHHSEPSIIEDREVFNKSSHSLTSVLPTSNLLSTSLNSISKSIRKDENSDTFNSKMTSDLFSSMIHSENQPQSLQLNNQTENFTNDLKQNNDISNKYTSVENRITNSKSNGLGLYCILNTIGLGNFSQVKLATHILTKERVAIKVLDKSKMNTSTRRLLSQEISILESLHHPNIIRLYEVIETFSHLNLVMEYVAGGDLNRRIVKYGKLSESEGRIVFAQLIAAVNHLHERNIIHRDIKAENILFTYDIKHTTTTTDTTETFIKTKKFKKELKQKNHQTMNDENKPFGKIQKLLHQQHQQQRHQHHQPHQHPNLLQSLHKPHNNVTSSKLKMKQEYSKNNPLHNMNSINNGKKLVKHKLHQFNSMEGDDNDDDDEVEGSLNDLCPDHYRVKLVDFGFSKLIKETNQQLTTFCGSPAYAAPELFESKSYRGGPVDMWALGIVLFFMLTGLLPFNGTTVGQVRRLVLNNSGLQPPDYLSPAAADLYRNLTTRQPDLRPTASQLIKYAQFARKDLTPIEIILRQRSTWTNWLTGQTFPKPLPRFKHCPPLPTTPQIKQNLINSSSSGYKINKNISMDKITSNDEIPLSNHLIHKQSIHTIPSITNNQTDHETLNQLNEINSSDQDDAELEAANYLLSNLGITTDEIQNSYNYSTRCAVTGAYRIMLHKIHRSRRLSQLDQITLSPYNTKDNSIKSFKFNSNLSTIQQSSNNLQENSFQSKLIPLKFNEYSNDSFKQNNSIRKLNTNKKLHQKSSSRLCYLI
ncbi:unnamed protein product [Schistosoma mattheei]|uniref:non-specific serine/threonine protein kinase n=1 Tax=Schistosoma mattheei TaxID=31246 RepID=A0AA85AQM9_9TREM|nr:unnamed protein product [Schistosoma mattheei]